MPHSAALQTLKRLKHLLGRRIFVDAGAMLIVLVLFIGQAVAQIEQSIVVLVNDEPISAWDIQQRMQFYSVTARQPASPELRKKVVEELILERLQLQEAKKNNITVSDDDITKSIGKIAQGNNMTAEKLLAALAQMGVNSMTFKEKVKANIAWQRAVGRKFSGRVSVSNAEIDKAMKDKGDSSPGSSEANVEVQLQRVRLDLPGSPDQKEIVLRLVEAEKLRARVKSCDALADQVKSLRKASVNNIGRKNVEQMAQPIRAHLLVAQDGELTPPNITASGIELYAVCGRRAKSDEESEERKEVRAKLMQQEYSILAQRHLRDLRQDAYVEFR